VADVRKSGERGRRSGDSCRGYKPRKRDHRHSSPRGARVRTNDARRKNATRIGMKIR
jgi:hypothetical protein